MEADMTGAAVLTLDAGGCVSDANGDAVTLFGGIGLLGLHISVLLPDEAEALRSAGEVRTTVVRPNGTPVPVYVSLRGDTAGAQLVVREIDEAQLTAEAQGMFDVVFDRSPLGTAIFNTDGRYLRVNDPLCRLLGRTRRELLGRRDQEFTHPDDREADIDAAWRILRGELDAWQTEKRFVRPDGSVVWAIANLTFLRDRAGVPLCWVGQFQDITARQRMQDELRERERQLADAQALAHVGSWEFDRKAERLRWSDELCRIFGQPTGFSPTLDELYALVHPDDRDDLIAHVQDALAGTYSDSVYRIVRPDGEVRCVHSRRFGSARTPGQPPRMWGTTQDVTDRVEAETELRRAREHAEAIVAAMSEGYALTVDGRLVSVNDALCALTGFDRAQLVGAGMPFPFWPPDQLEESRAIRDRIVAGGGGTFEILLARADGTRFMAEITAQAARHPDGRLLGFVNTIRDISERKRYEAELDRERRDLRSAQALARVGSWEYELTGARAGRWSQELWRLIGVPPTPAPPPLHELAAMVHAEDRQRVAARVTEMLASPRPFEEEFTVVRSDGTEVRLALRAELTAAAESRGPTAFGTVQDITERAERDREQFALRRIAELVANGAEPGAVFAATAEHLRELFRSYSGVVAQFDDDARVATLVSGRTSDGRDMTGAIFPLDEPSAVATVYSTQRPARFDRSTPSAAPFPQTDVISAVAAPIIVQSRVWGAIGASFTVRPAPPGADDRLARFAALVAMAIGNSEAWETLHRQAQTDSLTRLANRRAFRARLRSELKRADRSGRPLSLVLLDIDHFKAVNDTHGHPVGDVVLTEFARRLAGTTREDELVARVGGEEFALLLPGTDAATAVQAAERLRELVGTEAFHGVGMLTVSAGVSTRGPQSTVETMMSEADAALYRAKREGRNRSVLHSAQ